MKALCSSLDNYKVNNLINIFPNSLGIVSFSIAFVLFSMACIIISWIYLQQRIARLGSDSAVQSVIFPIFTKMMWLLVVTNIYFALLMLLFPADPAGSNSTIVTWCYPVLFTLQHFVIEGIAFLFMQKGLGNHAAKGAFKLNMIWCIITFMCQIIIFQNPGVPAIVTNALWSLVLLVFYGCLWLLPQEKLFRRTAALQYAKFWFVFRIFALTFYILAAIDSTHNVGECLYYLGVFLPFGLLEPIVCYFSLLQDSRWWQGLTISSSYNPVTSNDLRTPLHGMDLPLDMAQNLALTMDRVGQSSSFKLLNFANIFLDKQKVLGQGSFSRVYKGTYKDIPCAIKLIFTLDLTEEIIKGVVAEATLLNAIKNPNIVNIFGVSVLPPSVCIVLELCDYGSLADVLRGSSSRRPLNLSLPDKMFLALGCAKGVAAIHAFHRNMVHRDIKSFNFLVDGQLNAKLADLELGSDKGVSSQSSRADSQASSQSHGQLNTTSGDNFNVEDVLFNWIAPEVLVGELYTQASDVYSLALVLWEIIASEVPFHVAGEMRGSHVMRNQIISGFRQQIPFCDKAYQDLISKGWSQRPQERPQASEIATRMHNIWVVTWVTSKLNDALQGSYDVFLHVDKFLNSASGVEFKQSKECLLPSSTSAGNIWSRSFAMSPHFAMVPQVSRFSSRMSGSMHDSQYASTNSTVLRPSASGLSVGSAPGSLLASQDLIYNIMGPSSSTVVPPTGLASDNVPPPDTPSLQALIASRRSWNFIDAIPEPIAILSGQYPYMILKCSHSFSALIRTSAECSFGMVLDQLLDTRNTDEARESGGQSDRNKLLEEMEKDLSLLQDLYDSVAADGYGHALLHIANGDNEKMKISMHACGVLQDSADSSPVAAAPKMDGDAANAVIEATQNINTYDIFDKAVENREKEKPQILFYVVCMSEVTENTDEDLLCTERTSSLRAMSNNSNGGGRTSIFSAKDGSLNLKGGESTNSLFAWLTGRGNKSHASNSSSSLRRWGLTQDI